MLGSEKSARMVNCAGEEFFNQQQDDPLAYGPYTVQLKALAKQVRAGKARYDGGYYAGFDHCDAAEVDAYTTYGKTYRQLGCAFPSNWSRPRSRRIIGRAGSTSTPKRCGRPCRDSMSPAALAATATGLIALATYDGKVVADGVARDLPTSTPLPLVEQEIELESRRLDACAIPRNDGPAPIKVKERVRAADVGERRASRNPTPA
jgi:succinate dehydrogenase / fumarate reductase flavoprotein subunit